MNITDTASFADWLENRPEAMPDWTPADGVIVFEPFVCPKCDNSVAGCDYCLPPF